MRWLGAEIAATELSVRDYRVDDEPSFDEECRTQPGNSDAVWHIA